MRRGRTHDMPYSAIRPRRANAVVNLAPGAAKRRSHIIACTRPMPAHAPLIAAMTGLVSVVWYCGGWAGAAGHRAAALRRCPAASPCRRRHRSPCPRRSPRDPSRDRRRLGRAGRSTPLSSPVQAFSRSGRLRVRRATPRDRRGRRRQPWADATPRPPRRPRPRRAAPVYEVSLEGTTVDHDASLPARTPGSLRTVIS